MLNKPLRLVVNAAAGKMGARVATLAATDSNFVLVACVFNKATGNAHGATAIKPEEIKDFLSRADVLVDFSTPQACVSAIKAAAEAKKPVVTGTTGFSTVQLAQIHSCTRKIPLLMSPNFSPAVNLLFRLAAEAASILKTYEASISEIHHNQKRDAPSGTALRISREIMASRKNEVEVPTVSQRLGDVVGEHTLTLAGPFERLEITHRAHSRALFARGALDAAIWLARKKPGLYDMTNLLNLP